VLSSRLRRPSEAVASTQKVQKRSLEVHHQYIDRNGRTLSLNELFTNQIQSITPFAMAYLTFVGISLPLSIDQLPLLCSDQIPYRSSVVPGMGRPSGSHAAGRALASLLSDNSGRHKSLPESVYGGGDRSSLEALGPLLSWRVYNSVDQAR